MKKIYLAVSLVGLTAAVAYATAPGTQSAGKAGPNTLQYHSYDGLICTDCHTLHNSENGATVNQSGQGGTQLNRELLKRGDWTDMCLSCHTEGSNTSSTVLLSGVENTGWVAPPVMSINGTYTGSMPAGDFYFSKNDAKKGHNPSYTKGADLTGAGTSLLMPADATLKALPPGGTSITDKEWSCHSCHGMHSRFSDTYSAWRQLKRKVNGKVVTGSETAGTVETSGGTSGTTTAGYEPIMSNSRGDIQGTTYKFSRADSNPLEGADLMLAESDTNKNVYRGGFSSFCSACHGDFHGGTGETRATDNAKTNIGQTWQRHPTNVKLNETSIVQTNNGSSTSGAKYGITTYTKVVSNAQSTNPNPVGYDWRYPLVQDNADFTVKSTVAAWSNASTALGTSRIMCLTCHKAHASKFDNMTRWDANAHSFLASGATSDVGDGPAVGDNPAYGCGKCHQKGGAKAFVKEI